MKGFCAMFLTVAIVGCARYEHHIVEPADVAQRIGRDPVQFSYDPLDYWLVTADGRLVMRIYNPTDETILLLGGESTVVAPTGQSHPVQGGAIARGSYIKLILPPMRPMARATGPRVGVGMGVGIGAGRARSGVGAGVGYGTPRRYVVEDPGDALYWNWPPDTSIRMSLRFQTDEGAFRHDFVIRRQRER